MNKILVLGDVMLDVFTYGESNRISPEAPVPVVHSTALSFFGGGASNLALNLASLGSEVTVLAASSDDEDGRKLLRLCEHPNLKVVNLLVGGTTTKNRILVNNHHHIRIDTDYILNASEAEMYKEKAKEHITRGGILVFSDYAKGTNLHFPEIVKMAHSFENTIFVDPKSKDWEMYRFANFLTPNLKEIEEQIGPWRNVSELVGLSRKILTQYELEGLIITRGENGVIAITQAGEVLDVQGIPTQVSEVSGAGDTFLACFVNEYLRSNNLLESIEYANIEASRSVGFPGITIANSLQKIQTGAGIVK